MMHHLVELAEELSVSGRTWMDGTDRKDVDGQDGMNGRNGRDRRDGRGRDGTDMDGWDGWDGRGRTDRRERNEIRLQFPRRSCLNGQRCHCLMQAFLLV